MQILLNDFARSFDLDHRVHGTRLGDLVQQAIRRLEAEDLPKWGSSGPADHRKTRHGRSFDFNYTPHLFPGMELHLRFAHELQFGMLPREVPAGAPISIAAVLESYCHLSGDLFGWEMLADGRFLIWIVDIAGHGVRAGIASAVLKLLVENLRQRGRIGSLVTELNDIFVGCLRKDADNLYATAFFMALSDDGSACYASAGHPPVLLRREHGKIEELASTGMPIGMFPDRLYTATEVRLQSDDTMLLYTDGLVETTNHKGVFFGIERLRRHMSSKFDTPRSLTDSLYLSISGYQDMATLNDDVTFVAARVKTAPTH